ncbi:MAG: hypothetical protein AB1Z23_12540 [Eubacteriales bacterium]
MKYYHGSIVPNLKTLYPFNTNNSLSQRDCVYLTDKKEMALLYIWVRKFAWLTYGFDKEGTVVFGETHKDALKEFYKDVKGYIYTVELDNALENDTSIRNVATVYSEVDVLGCEVIEDVYEEILKYEKQGRIKIRRYEQLSEKEHAKNREMILNTLKSGDLEKKDRALLAYIKMRFSDIYLEFLNTTI